jgi:nucleotide-binding universal stress UspA family protein
MVMFFLVFLFSLAGFFIYDGTCCHPPMAHRHDALYRGFKPAKGPGLVPLPPDTTLLHPAKHTFRDLDAKNKAFGPARTDSLRPLALDTAPLVVVPPDATIRAEGPILAAYDGSAPSREAFHLFALLGLAGESPVRVAAIARTQDAAQAMAEEGCAVLRQHGVAADPLACVGSDVAGLSLAEAEAIGARALVMGAFGGSSLLRMLIGSTTDRLLYQARVPIFIHR